VRCQRCLVHYSREIEDTIKYKNPGKEFLPFTKKFRKILRDAIRMVDEPDHGERLKAEARLEARIDVLIASYSSSKEKNRARLIKRLRRENGMLFAFLEDDGPEYWQTIAETRKCANGHSIRIVAAGQ